MARRRGFWFVQVKSRASFSTGTCSVKPPLPGLNGLLENLGQGAALWCLFFVVLDANWQSKWIAGGALMLKMKPARHEPAPSNSSTEKGYSGTAAPDLRPHVVRGH
jgi:hypothetical protein